MRAVIQKVVNASVAVDGKTISSIGRGLLVLVGIDRYDTPTDATQIIKKILSARLFEDDSGSHWKKSVKDIDGEVLCVSQFTLLAGFKGSKPDFHESMSTIPSKAFYAAFMEEIGRAYHPSKIKDGEFGAMMQVSLTNDGPVTILLSSRDKASKPPTPAGSVDPSRSATPAPLTTTPSNAAEAGKGEGKGKGKVKNKGSLHPKFGSAPIAPSTSDDVTAGPHDSISTALSERQQAPPESTRIVAPVQPAQDGVDGLVH